MRRAALLLAAALVGGCAEHWVKPGATEADFAAVNAACIARSYTMFAPMPVTEQVGGGYYLPGQEICHRRGPYLSCFELPGQFEPPIYGTVDANDPARVPVVRQCLYQGGWRPEG